MLKAGYVALTLAIAALLVIGCSSAGVEPVTVPDATDVPTAEAQTDSQRTLWGVWNISFDTVEMEVIIESARNLQVHFNITDMITPPECDDCLEIAVNSFDPVTRIIDVDVTLRNPYQINGRDVRGILYTNDYGHELRNADDWTKLWDIPGGETINPFRAFAKEEANHIFAGLAEHTENYLVYIPIPPLYAGITYAVDASWPGNCKEPFEITNFSQEDIYDTTWSSGNIYVDARDWQDDVDKVTLVAPEITGEDFTQFNPDSGDTWQLNLTNNQGAPAGDYEVRIIASSTNSGTLALYDYKSITISVAPPIEGWARTWGGSSSDLGMGVAIDGSGNAYVTGVFEDIADLDPGPGVDEHTSNGIIDIFLSKFDSAGVFQWARTWGGGDYDCSWGVAIDGSGNAYITGVFVGTADFDPGTGVDEHTSSGGYDVFLSKFDSAGEFQWARTWGGGYSEDVRGVAIDGSGNAYITGYFRNTVDFYPGPGVDEHTSNGEHDIFLSKFDSAGDFQWARTWGGSSDDGGYGVAIDGSGNAYVTGYFQGTVDFDPGTGVDEQSTGGFLFDIFLSKFDSAGDFQWARTCGGGSLEVGYGVAIDGSDNAYITGYFAYIVDFDPGPGVDEHTANGVIDIFLSKFDSAGVFQWARTWGGSSEDVGWRVAIDGSGNAYITGYFEDIVDFAPGPGVDEHTSNGSYDIFLSKFDSAGEFQWARTWGGSSDDGGYGVAIDGSDDVYITGYFSDTVDFNPGPGVDEHTSNGGHDTFLSQFPPDGDW